MSANPDACQTCGRDCEKDDHIGRRDDLFALFALREAGRSDAVQVVRGMSPDALPALAEALTVLSGIVAEVARDHGIGL